MPATRPSDVTQHVSVPVGGPPLVGAAGSTVSVAPMVMFFIAASVAIAVVTLGLAPNMDAFGLSTSSFWRVAVGLRAGSWGEGGEGGGGTGGQHARHRPKTGALTLHPILFARFCPLVAHAPRSAHSTGKRGRLASTLPLASKQVRAMAPSLLLLTPATGTADAATSKVRHAV